MDAALTLAMSSSMCFGIALVSGRVGLRTLDARSGAAVSIPTAAVLLALAAPFAFDVEGFTLRAGLLFALVGVFFPALVTILTFRSNQELGPTVTGAVSGTAPLFAILAAGWFLGEPIPARAAVACVAIVAGVAVLSWRHDAVRPGFTAWSLGWPIAGAVLRGLAQTAAKAGLMLWPSPFSASLIGYAVSSVAVVAANRVGASQRRRKSSHGVVWFAVTGVLNGAAVLLMYGALERAPVSFVAPIVAAYPLVTALVSAGALREEPVTRRMLAGATMTVLAVAYLVAYR